MCSGQVLKTCCAIPIPSSSSASASSTAGASAGSGSGYGTTGGSGGNAGSSGDSSSNAGSAASGSTCPSASSYGSGGRRLAGYSAVTASMPAKSCPAGASNSVCAKAAAVLAAAQQPTVPQLVCQVGREGGPGSWS